MHLKRGAEMTIAQLDKNFEIKTNIDEPDIKWYSVLEEPFDIYGLYRTKEDGLFRRMPREVAEKVSDGILGWHTATAGGRIRFKTDSKYIALKVEYDKLYLASHQPELNVAGFDIHRIEDGKYILQGVMMPNMDDDKGYARKINAKGSLSDYLISMPMFNNISKIFIGLSRDAKLEHGGEYKIKTPFVYYGSSITHGGCASRPSNTYEAYISERFNADFINLGFSGSAKGEQAMFDYLATLKMSAFIYDYDWNSSYQEVKERYIEGYKTIRAAHPNIPIILVGYPTFNPEDNGGGRAQVKRDTYNYALSKGDTNVALVETPELCSGDYMYHCTVDGTHPNDLGFYRMAEKIGDALAQFFTEK